MGLINECRFKKVQVSIFCESQSTIHLTKNLLYRSWTKYINVRYHNIGEYAIRRLLEDRYQGVFDGHTKKGDSY